MISSSLQGKEIWGMSRTLAVNWAPLLDRSKDDVKTAVETSSDYIVKGAVGASCEISLLVSKQNHSDPSLTALDVALKQFYKVKSTLGEHKMLKSVKANVDEQWARHSHQLREQKIHKICATMMVQVYSAEKDKATIGTEFQVRLNRARKPATVWSDADQQSATERLECKIHLMTPAKRKNFNKLLQHLERQPLEQVGIKATGPRCIFAK